jgi:hypothetical protein
MRSRQTSILIVSYNVSALLERCLASLPSDADVIVVDNASSDDSAAMVEAKFKAARLVRMAHNAGFSAAINAGARIASGDRLLLLNPDTQLPPKALDMMAEALEKSPDTAAVGFRQVDAEGRFQLACGPEPTFVGELSRRFVQRRLDAASTLTARLLERLLAKRRRVAWVAGSSLLVWRADFERVGGFDARYFLFFEDIDFCLRLRGKNRFVYYDPSVTILHHRGASAQTSQRASQAAYRRSQILFWRTHRGRLWGRLIAAYVARQAKTT